MAMGIYKPGQGYWTRMMTAVAVGLLSAMGAHWLWGMLAVVRIGDVETVYIQAGAALLLLTVFAYLTWYLVGRKPKFVDFLIATEGEMRKVNWSTRREIMGSTWVVIGLTLVVALIISLLDFGIYTPLFRWMNVLESS